MRAGVARVLFDNDVPPLGDVTLAPSGMTGMSEALLARAMAEQVLANRFETEEDALKPVRRAFADSPLAFRVGALAALMRRR